MSDGEETERREDMGSGGVNTRRFLDVWASTMYTSLVGTLWRRLLWTSRWVRLVWRLKEGICVI